MEGEDLAITVLTCEGDIKDPTFPIKLRGLVAKLQNLISNEKRPLKVTKVEPWNSVRITFNIPLEAAQRLRQLAERGDRTLRELGILSVQIEGDQVITLTLASQYSEPQEIVLRKATTEEQDVASVSFNLPSTDSLPGPSSAEPAHKSLSQFLGHLVGGATASAATPGPSSRLEKSASPKLDTALNFRSPNVIAPSSTEPIPFPPSTVITTTVTLPSSSRLSPNVSVKSPGFGPFPFASMTHAMNTKNSTSPHYQPLLHIQSGSQRLSSSTQLTNTILSSGSSPSLGSSSLHKVSRTLSSSAFTSVSKTTVPTGSRANVALSSPLLVNLLQSENSGMQQNNKLMPPPSSQSANQAQKKKRKPRKSKDKAGDEANALSPGFSTLPSPPSYVAVRSPGSLDPLNALGSSLNMPVNSAASPSLQIANIHPMAQGQPPVSTIKSPSTSVHPQGLPPVSPVQGQPMVSTTRPLSTHPAISAYHQTQASRAVPNIHPQAQGQPQVHTGNLPLHTHIPVGSLQVQRASSSNNQSYAMSAPRNIPSSVTRSVLGSKEAPLGRAVEKAKESSRLDRGSAPSTPSTSTPDSNPFPSPPSSSDSKTKHLINPFTGQLEPMPSDEEEEEESIGSLPPFPDFEIDTSEKSQSERSLSDSGKDNNLSSDTDSGISKSITDLSQSSTECATTDSVRELNKSDNPKLDTVPSASSVPVEKIKLRLKLDSKSIRESKESDKRTRDSNLASSQKADSSPSSVSTLKKSAIEPRVPPLHISLRGPNAAVVVSPRKDDSKSKHSSVKDDHPAADVPSKGVPKRMRSPRAARTGEVPLATGKNLESLEKKAKGNLKELKKVKDELWSPNVKMSGGGIVEVSEKLVPTCMPSYDTYMATVSVSSSVVQGKSSGIFSLASRDSCKPEVLTLTSCSTGESVTLHSFSGAKSPQVAPVSETETTELLPTVKTDISLSASNVILPANRTSFAEGQKPLENSEKKSSSFENSPLMQTNHLPHSPSAPPLDSKDSAVQNSCPTDQTESQSASSLAVVSTVPLSSLSVSSSPCSKEDEAASKSNVQKQGGVSTDANKLCSAVAATAENVPSTTDSHKLQTTQCNTHLVVSNISEPIATSVNVDSVVQNEPKPEAVQKDSVDEVQKNDVNISSTANVKSCASSLSSEFKELPVSLVQDLPPAKTDGETLNQPVTTPNVPAVCSVAAETIEASPEEGSCTVDVKYNNAQIITTTTLAADSLSHVMEVPLLQPAPSPAKVCSADEDSSLVPCRGPVQATTEDTSTEGVSPVPSELSCKGSEALEEETNTSMLPPACDVNEGLLTPDKESKTDSPEEDRNRCVQLSELPTSTPGPPPPPPPDPCSKSENTCTPACPVKSKDPESETAVEKVTVSEEPQSASTVEPQSPLAAPLKIIQDSVVASDAQASESGVSSLKAEPEKPLSTSAISVSISSQTSQAEDSTALSSRSNPIDAGPSLESKLDAKAEAKKEITSESIHVVNTSSNSLVTSLLSPVKYLQNEVSSQKFKLIFKGSGQKATLPGGNASGSLVVPLNSSKVPIKLVALPGGASALSVRSTSNPNIVEIIGPKTAPNSPSSSPSPVRLVVSKMAPVMTCSNPGNMRNRVVVKSVVVTSTTPSLKLLSTNNLCSTSLSLSSGSSSTTTVLQSIPSAVVSNSSSTQHSSTSIVPEEAKVLNAAESSTTFFNSNLLEKISVFQSPINISAAKASVKSISASMSGSSSANNSSKDSASGPPETKVSVSYPESPSCPAKVGSNTSVNGPEILLLSDSNLKKEDSANVDNSLTLSQDKAIECNELNKEMSQKLLVDSIQKVSSQIKLEPKPKTENSDPSNSASSMNPADKKPMSELDNKVPSDDSVISVEKTVNSAITSNLTCSPKDQESSDAAASATLDLPDPSQNLLSEKVLASSTGPSSKDVSQKLQDVLVTSSLAETEEASPVSEKPVTDNCSSAVDDCTFNSVKEEETVEAGVSGSQDSKHGIVVSSENQIRPLAEETADHADNSKDAAKALAEDPQLEISLVYSKPLKRKCSENAAELIKACMGVEDGPKRGIVLKPGKGAEETPEKAPENKVEENIRMSLRIRRDEPLLKKVKGTANSDCSTDEEVAISELVTKSRTREKPPTRGPISNRDSPSELPTPGLANCRPKRRRSGSNESRNSVNSEEIKTRSREKANKKDEPIKKLPERSKRGTNKAQEQVVSSKLGIQRSARIRDQEAKPNALHNSKEEANSLSAKRKTRNTSESQEMLVSVKRRRYSKDGHR